MSQPMDLARTMFGDLQHELDNTRRMLQAVPADRLDFRAHARSYSVGELISHIANLPNWIVMTVESDELDLATLPGDRTAARAPEEALAEFDANAARARAAVAEAPAEAWGAPWTLRSGEHVHFTMPRAAVVRSMGINHMVHHRAQLGVNLRLLDVPVPGMYGPSADEQ